MVSSVALGKERVRIRIVPYPPRSVEVLAPHGKVYDFNDAVREEKEGNRICCEVVDVSAFDDQIHRAQSKLQ